jgi:tetratricopeptide (TPR) repeat protein
LETVSAALIVKNEEKFLPGCLASLAGRVDEIVVVETGSTDKTRSIALDAGARVLDFPWRQDFAAARNFGLDAVKARWVLYIDADERLVLPDGVRLASLLGNPAAIAARLKFRPIPRGTPVREYRLFKSRPDIRFVGAIHETILPNLEKLKGTPNSEIIEVDAELMHLGYEGDLTHKHRRNLPILRRMVQEWPDRLYYWLDLAQALRGLGEVDEARETCLQGLEIARIQTSPSSKSIAAMIAMNLAALKIKNGEDALATIQLGLDFEPGQPTLQFQMARVQINAGQFDEAIAILDQLIKLGPNGFTHPITSVDERLFGAFAYDLKSLALIRMGRRAEATECLKLASAMEPSEMSYRVKAIALGAR